MSQARIPALGNGKFPRIHDARHTFILYSYAKLTGELSLDFYTALPIIAAYVGHTNIKDTQRYIHLPEFDYSGITAIGNPVIDTFLPEVTFDV
jgi:integrase